MLRKGPGGDYSAGPLHDVGRQEIYVDFPEYGNDLLCSHVLRFLKHVLQ